MITVSSLTKKFGQKIAVNNVSFDVPDGKVVGFIGPNGSGKTTTMRCILGLTKQDSGSALIDGVIYRKLKDPFKKVGSLIDAKAFHKSRSAYSHIHFAAACAGVSKKRVDQVLEITGLSKVAKKKAGTYSLGMAQRIGVATALLGDPQILILDEPVNGLDPDGVKWIRDLCRGFADNGRCVLISSHLMSELEQIVDEVVIMGQGEVLQKGSLAHIKHLTGMQSTFKVKTINNPEFLSELKKRNIDSSIDGEFIVVKNIPAEIIGALALDTGTVVTHLSSDSISLEEAYMKLTSQKVEFKSTQEVSNA